MKEIWLMWVAVKSFYRNQVLHYYHDEIMEAGQYLDVKKGKVVKVKEFRNAVEEQRTRNGPIKVDRYSFAFDLSLHFRNDDKNEAEQKYYADLIHGVNNKSVVILATERESLIQDIIDSCIDAGHISKDEEGKLSLTGEGRKFKELDGLIKAWGKEIAEILGTWRTIIITAVGTFGLLKIGLIAEWIGIFGEWVMSLLKLTNGQ